MIAKIIEQQTNQLSSFTTMFNNKHIDILGTKEEPVFVVNQICELIELDTESRMLLDIKKEGFFDTCKLQVSEIELLKKKYHNKIPRVTNEEGLYEMLFRSKKPIAK